MDGVSLSDPTRGYISKGVAFDAIEEIEMLTGAISAEVGQMAGGYINVVSKSGGNQFSGSAPLQYNGEGFSQSTLPVEHRAPFGIRTAIFDKFYLDASLTLGGPIIKDKLWFFVNPQYGRQTRTTSFIPFTDPLGDFHDTRMTQKKEPVDVRQALGADLEQAEVHGHVAVHRFERGPELEPGQRAGRFATYRGVAVDMTSQTVSTVLTYIIDQNTFAEFRGGFVYQYRTPSS